MPVNKRIQREDIIDTAMKILIKEGSDRINARNIAKYMNCSTQPIYSEFKNMDELKCELNKEAFKYYDVKVEEYIKQNKHSEYMAFGLAMINIARDEKNLFQYLFMTKDIVKLDLFDESITSKIINVLAENEKIPREIAIKLHEKMVMHIFGLTVLIYGGYYNCTEEDAERILNEEYEMLRLFFDHNKI